MVKNIFKNSGPFVVLIVLIFVSGCACNPTWKDGLLKGAALGAALGGVSGGIYGARGDDDEIFEHGAEGAAIGAIVGGVIGAFTYRCEEPKVAEVQVADMDTDGDGVPDNLDQCPNTPTGVKVDFKGCPLDTDGDGVPDYKDKCPETPKGVKVDAQGCPLDSDGDGVYDYMDECPDTPKNTKVDRKGCPIKTDMDSDGDGVLDSMDKCPDTPRGARVNEVGCWVLQNVNFDFDKSEIKSEWYPILDEVVVVLNNNPNLKVEIQGHTDSTGTERYNEGLSERRAQAVMNYLIGKGIDKDRLSAAGYGETRPLASNDTPEGQSLNRRAQISPVD